MKIQVGEYVRTDKGNIGKLVEIRCGKSEDGEKLIDVYFLDNGIWTLKKYILNHSFNIIDLIEVGDYVNGYKVEKKANGLIYVDYCWDCNLYTMVTNKIDDIKSIVTKQAFESIKYKV